jgi:cation transport ATPase
MNRILSIATLALLVPAAYAADTTKFTVNGMVCAFCAQGIEKRVGAMPETAALYVYLERRLVAVEAKPGRTLDVPRITAEIVDAGYAVARTESVTQSVAEIRAQMKSKK